jgi:3-methyladenine DNA glycosylase/8-oxoguanine DNA glycosylase
MTANQTGWGEIPGEPWWPSAKTSTGVSPRQSEILLRVLNYDLAATLDSGQAFRWQEQNNSWIGVIGKHWVRLTQTPDGIHAITAAPVENWDWLRQFLQTEIDLTAVLKTFPDDEPMRAAVANCRGLRLLRQDPWECLASFILSSTKQIVQIRQIVSMLCERFGEPVFSLSSQKGGEDRGEEANYFRVQIPSPQPYPRLGGAREKKPRGLHKLLAYLSVPLSPLNGERAGVRGNFISKENPLFYSFPTAERLARASEVELRACKMGFRAPSLLAAARQIAEGRFDLERIRQLPHAEACAELMRLRGVGGKIADCVLLFAYGFDSAFPVDVWIERALQQLYFPRRRASKQRLRRFAATHFGPHAGYAQQYLFHYIRTKLR